MAIANAHHCRITALFSIVMIISIQKVCPALTNLNIPDRPTRSYVNLADINLGSLFAITDRENQCGHNLRVPIMQQVVEAVVFAVEKINRNDSILPNIKLGFAILDDCNAESITAVQSLRFLPRISRSSDSCPQTAPSNTSGHASDEYYDVVGIVGPWTSSNGITVSNILGPALIPQISFSATSDALSLKSDYPYFMRVVPPDALQMKAILEFISRQGWSYFSVLYSEGSYGEYAYEVITRTISSLGLCIAAERKLYLNMGVEEFRVIVKDLMKYASARVVLMVCIEEDVAKTFQAVYDLNVPGRFIWIGTDAWAHVVSWLYSRYRKSVHGSLTTMFYAPPAEEFTNYFQNLKPSQSRNPWFKEFWERMLNCSFSQKTCDESIDIKTSPDYIDMSEAVYGIDAVYAYAHALHRLLIDKCPGVKGAKARACVNGSLLLQYLRETSFNGETGHVDFDENGNRIGKYVIRQIIHDETIFQREVVIVDAENSYQMETLSNMTWAHLRPLDANFSRNARFPGTKYHVPDGTAPISVCSRLCEVGEQKIRREPPCCWDCQKCRENERLVTDLTKCQQCPEFSWPDASTNFTSCAPIDPTFPLLSDPHIISVWSFSVAGIVLTAIVLIIFVKHRNERVIKASSRELAFFQFTAFLIGYTTMAITTLHPTNQLCTVSFLLFSLSFNWLYAPLLIKTIRMYRIFESAKRRNTRPRGIGPFSQVFFTLIIILGQIATCMIVIATSNPRARLKTPSKFEKYVELYCDFTLPGMISFVAYNLTLVCLCSVFAFKTRRLPGIFNESRFISMCIFTTLIIWLVFIPSFATASREHLRNFLLALALMFNHTVALVLLFVPRICALHYAERFSIGPSRTTASLGFAYDRSRKGGTTTNATSSMISSDVDPKRLPSILMSSGATHKFAIVDPSGLTLMNDIATRNPSRAAPRNSLASPTPSRTTVFLTPEPSQENLSVA